MMDRSRIEAPSPHAQTCGACHASGTALATGQWCKRCRGRGYVHRCHGRRMTCPKWIPTHEEYCAGCKYDREHGHG